MLWLILLLCLGLAGMTGFFRGPIAAAFSLLGILFGVWLAKPLAPLAARLLSVLGFDQSLWRFFLPGFIAFLFVLVIFMIVGHVLHQKMVIHFEDYKEKDNEVVYYRWARLYQRLGLCLGLLNGAVYFFLLMVPVYAAGYFTTEAAGADLPATARLLTRLRADLHDSNLDRVIAAHDPLPPEAYQAGDIIDLVLRNPPLAPRLAHYPPLLVLAENPQIKALGDDPQFQQLLQSQPKISDFLAQPKVQALTTNAAIADQVRDLLGRDLPDLQAYLTTGKSPNYDSQTILGVWEIDIRASLAAERTRNAKLTARQYAALRESLVPLLNGLSLTARLDNDLILKKQRPDSPETTAVARGAWRKSGDSYEITLPGNHPDTTPISLDPDGTLRLPRDGHVLVFNKEP